MIKRRAALLATFAVVYAITVCGLSACSAGQHKIVQSSQGCSECHAGDKATYDVSDPKGATEVNTTFTVSVSGSSPQVVVCKPVFTAEDGSVCTPVQVKAVSVSGGEAQVTVDEGVWAIAISGNDSSTYKIVKASSSCSNAELSI